MTVSIQDIELARVRLQGRIRETPMLGVVDATRPVTDAELYLKLENLQISGSFKARGATNTLLSLPPERLAKGLITASGGNHGLGVAAAARGAGVPAKVFLPANTPAAKADKIRRWGAEVIRHGAVWDDANVKAMETAELTGMLYVHPFALPSVIAGQGTVGLEILDQRPDVDIVVVAIGGGGLMSGVATAIKSIRPEVRVIGVEPEGAPTLYQSVRQGAVVALDEITTRANTLAPRRSEAINLALISRHTDEIVLVSDADMEAAADWLWFELGIAAELAAAAGIAALASGKIVAEAGSKVCVLICGAGEDGFTGKKK
jgi:threonine dehydratase